MLTRSPVRLRSRALPRKYATRCAMRSHGSRPRQVSEGAGTEEVQLLGSTEPTPRQAGRVLVIDAAGRVLLLEGFDPAEPDSRYWFTIGGGLNDGEDTAQAALRELREEAGIAAAADELAGPVWQRSTEFSFDGTRYRQEEDYYLLRVGHVPVSLTGLDDIERRTVTGYCWWSHQELDATAQPFFPAELPDLLRRLAFPDRGA
jgi:8-oxo-dGTP pyrophosphatase MutT (NUDIX family)